MIHSRWLRIACYIVFITCIMMTGFWAGSYISRSFPVQAAKTSNSSVQHEDTTEYPA